MYVFFKAVALKKFSDLTLDTVTVPKRKPCAREISFWIFICVLKESVNICLFFLENFNFLVISSRGLGGVGL